MTDVRERQLREVARLSFAHGPVGRRHPLNTVEEVAAFGERQAEQIQPLSRANTADCGDERLTIALASGENSRAVLDERIVPQLFGGLGLATTKAVVAANAAIVKDAKDVWSAYKTVSELLSTMAAPDGSLWEDGGHDGCGASNAVESSVANEVALELVLPAVGLLVPDNGSNAELLAKNLATKRARLGDGFYGTWDPQNHKDHLTSRVPHNFSYLLVDPNDHETHGHNGSGLVVVADEGMGYQKNGEAFAVTLPTMQYLADQLGGSTEEKQRILLGFADDTLHVGAGLLAPNFPVFA